MIPVLIPNFVKIKLNALREGGGGNLHPPHDMGLLFTLLVVRHNRQIQLTC